jgi:hypothetical protein
MATNNLRIIYNNIVDLSTTTLSASTTQNATNTPVTSLAKDTKSLVWRSAATTAASTAVTAMLAVSFASTIIGGVVLPFTNINSNTATIRVIGYTGTAASVGGTADTPTFTAGTTQVFDTGNIQACPWNTLALPNWNSNPVGASSYSYGGGTYLRVWLTPGQQVACTSIVIVITDNYSTSAAGRYIEASRLVIGGYWSPKYNTGYGLSGTIKDLSTHERSEAGDLVSRRAPRFNSLSFDLKWLDVSDRVQMTKILLGNGLPRPMLVSLFPDNTGTATDYEKERAHQIYGKLVTLPGVTLDTPFTYSTQFDIEEV